MVIVFKHQSRKTKNYQPYKDSYWSQRDVSCMYMIAKLISRKKKLLPRVTQVPILEFLTSLWKNLRTKMASKCMNIDVSQI